MNCIFCSLETYKPSPDALTFICGDCTQLLQGQSQEKLKAAYALALEKGQDKKAEALLMFIEEEEDVRKTKDTKRDTIRREALRMVKLARRKIGEQQAVG